MELLPDGISSIHIVLPGQTNPHGTLFGGVALSYMDEAAAIIAQRWAQGPVVTAHIDSVDFKAPIKQGEAVTVEASLESVGNTSMKIVVNLYGENLSTGKRQHCTTAKFVMVAIDADGKPKPVRKPDAVTPYCDGCRRNVPVVRQPEDGTYLCTECEKLYPLPPK